ncbi:putative ATP-grasp-modified RiPP [Streptomyces sp. NPDC057638]|uniref:putative ATP-grasp-modified RiPP n=1 Tax=Streptomyces sp. NPDC057638 TaxID=3346190 RepID=UPI003673FBBA
MGTAVRPQPWGARRLATYPTTVELPYTGVEIDPERQTTRYLDAAGRRMEMGDEDGKHGTSKATASQTATAADGGGPQPPPPADTDAIEDHASD